jgi:hypothetical protein
VERVDESPSGALLAGRAIHHAIEWAEDQESPAPESVAEVFLEGFTKSIEAVGDQPIHWSGRKTKEFPRGEDLLWWTRQGPMMLRRYLAVREAQRILGWKRVDESVERRISVPLPSGADLVGVLDQMILSDENGELIIVDWKTGTMRLPALQLAVYAWIVKQALEFTVTRGQFVYLRSVDVSKRVVTHELEDLIPLVPGLFENLEKGIEHGIFLINPGPFCPSCSVRAHCPYGKTLENRKAS